MNVEPNEIEELRTAFLQYVQSQGDSSVHLKDLTRAKTDDSWLSRFLLHHDKDQKLALDMMKEVVEWRKNFKLNEIRHDNIRMDYMVEGGFFPRGRDKDGSALLVFKCKKHVKGSRDMDEVKRIVLYWMERMEREEKGKPITIFFDMEGCGLSNMDIEFTKYLIGLFKQYYPFFLNFILIYEMSWVLNAALNIIKSLLPPKAVQKIQMLKKANVFTYVPEDQALKCWGGKDEYVFSFVADSPEEPIASSASNKKVHFAAEHGDQMNDSAVSWDKETTEGSALSITPSSLLSFVKDAADEFVTTLEIKNTDSKTNISYKLKTNAPQKFRVRPSAGVLVPGGSANITITLLPAYQVSGLSKDKFLVMSVPVTSTHLSASELADLWKNTSEHVSQHRLRCAQLGNDLSKNGYGTGVQMGSSMTENQQMSKLTTTVTQVQECQLKLHKSVCFAQMLQIINLILLVIIGIALIFVMRSVNSADDLPMDEPSQMCNHQPEEL